jgi:hypothetical protein
MPPSLSRALFLAAAIIFNTAVTASADSPAGPPSAELSKLQQIVTNLGYNTTWSSDNQHFYFDYPSANYTYRIDIAVSTAGDLIYAYNYIDTFDATQIAKMPYVKMLEFQNSGNVFFSLDNTGKGEDLYANEVFGTAGVNPVILRTQLQGLVSALDSTDTLWNSKLWK